MVRNFRIAAIFIALIFSSRGAFAAGANWYVQKGATGSNNGTSWTNAWNEMSQINFSTVACGDTIWIAGGTYTSNLSINKSCTASSVLNINRVLSSDSVPTSAAGWNSSFDSQVIMSESEIFINGGSYYTINGRIGTTANNNFGISVRCTASTGCEGIGPVQAGNLSHITVSYVELFGPPCITGGGDGPGTCGSLNGGAAAGFNIAPSSSTIDSLLLDHMWIHRWSETIRASGWQNCVIQYSDIDTMRQANNGGDHEDIIFSYDQTNFTFRYNIVWGSPNDGVFFYGNEVNTQIYGNVFFHNGASVLTFYQGFSHNVYIYNNVFQNDNTFGDYEPDWLYFISGSNMSGAIENNIFENTNINGSTGSMVVDYNAYSSNNGKQDSGSHSFTYNAGTLGASILFLSESPSNPLAANFHLSSLGATTLQNGVSLPSPYNMDADGNTRGSDGHWYIGAYSVGSGSVSSTPQPPTGLVITVQ